MTGLATGDKLARLLVTIVNPQSRKRMDLRENVAVFVLSFLIGQSNEAVYIKEKGFLARKQIHSFI